MNTSSSKTISSSMPARCQLAATEKGTECLVLKNGCPGNSHTAAKHSLGQSMARDVPNNLNIILDLCGGSGAWSKPYAEAGYDVRNITLPEYDVRNYKPPENVYGILAAPPCKEFSMAKGNKPRDFEGAMEIVKACLNIIWNCHPVFWCLENPRGFLRQFLGKPPLTVHFWEFGDDLGKPTDLWGYYNPPKPIYTEPPELLKKWEKIKGLKSVQNMSRQQVRAVTPPCFAKAFFKANR